MATKSKDATGNEIDSLSFEQAFSRLAQAVERLQAGNLSLEQAIAEFEVGQSLAERCTKLLDEAELKVSQVSVSTPSVISETVASYTLDLFTLHTGVGDGATDDDDALGSDDEFKDIPF